MTIEVPIWLLVTIAFVLYIAGIICGAVAMRSEERKPFTGGKERAAYRKLTED